MVCVVKPYDRRAYKRSSEVNYFSTFFGSSIFYLLTQCIFSNIKSKVFKKQEVVYKLDNNSISIKPTVEILSSNLNDLHRCSDSNCGELHREEELLKQDETNEHRVSFMCPYTYECQNSRVRYVGLWSLYRHVVAKHASHFSEPRCFHSECHADDKKPFENWPTVLRHIISEHSQAVEIQTRSTTLPSKAEQTKSEKCPFDHCPLLFHSTNQFSHHLIKCHPYPLRCPYSPECNKADSAENYKGVMELEEHIKTNHLEQYQNFMCFNSICQQKREFSNWHSVIDHIVIKHWMDIKSN